MSILCPSALDVKHEHQKSLRDRRQRNSCIDQKGKFEGRSQAPQVNFDPFSVALAKVFKFASALEDLNFNFSVVGMGSIPMRYP